MGIKEAVFGGALAMASRGSTQIEKAEMDSMVSECCSKALRIILGARIPHRQVQGARRGSGRDGYDCMYMIGAGGGCGSARKESTELFNLEVESSDHVQKSVDVCTRGVSHEPMVVDIFLQQPAGTMEVPSSSSVKESSNRRRRCDEWSESPQQVPNLRGEPWSGGSDGCSVAPGRVASRTLIERWVVSYDQTKQAFAEADAALDEDFSRLGQGRGIAPSAIPTYDALKLHVVYKRIVIMLRSLYCLVRTLPAFRLFNPPNSVSNPPRFFLSYMVSHAPSVLSEQDKEEMTKCNLTPIETQWGRLCIAAMYKNVSPVTTLEVVPQFVPEIIHDYLSSRTTQPLRRFDRVGSFPESRGRSDGRAVCVAPSPGSVPKSPTSVLRRLYSWSAVIRKIFSEKQVAELSQSGLKHSVYCPSEFLRGGFRTSSKGPIDNNHEDLEECPFAIDDGEAGDYRSRVGSPGVRSKVPDSPDFQGNIPGADAGALVRILTGAPPLRQQWAPSAVTHLPVPQAGRSPHHPVPRTTGIVEKIPPPIELTHIKVKTASDVLKELKEYQDLRDFLVRQSREFRAFTRSL